MPNGDKKKWQWPWESYGKGWVFPWQAELYWPWDIGLRPESKWWDIWAKRYEPGVEPAFWGKESTKTPAPAPRYFQPGYTPTGEEVSPPPPKEQWAVEPPEYIEGITETLGWYLEGLGIITVGDYQRWVADSFPEGYASYTDQLREAQYQWEQRVLKPARREQGITGPIYRGPMTDREAKEKLLENYRRAHGKEPTGWEADLFRRLLNEVK